MLADAAAARDVRDEAAASEAVDRANDGEDAFNRLGTTELRSVAVALGLVRGFDSEEPVVDVGDEDV